MLSKIAKLSLVSTTLAPIFLTLWFIDFSKNWRLTDGLSFLVIAISLSIICWCLLKLSSQRLEKIPVKISAVKTADKEIVGFILVYLLPLINKTSVTVNITVLVFVSILFFVIVFTSNAYHFNPLIGFFGYHFYEIMVDGGITYILITRKNISNCKSIHQVVQISEYMILEA